MSLGVGEAKCLKKKKLEKARIINLCWFLLDPWRRATGVCPWCILNHYKEFHLKAMCTYVLIHTSLMQSCCSLSWSCFGLFRVSKAESLFKSKEIVIANDVQQRQRQMRQHTHTQFKLWDYTLKGNKITSLSRNTSRVSRPHGAVSFPPQTEELTNTQHKNVLTLD